MKTEPNDQVNITLFNTGLTKLEYFSALAMQGILANGMFLVKHPDIDIQKLAVKTAYDLIDELNK